MGTENVNDRPMSLLLKSGDILVMSKESRLCFHGTLIMIDP